MTLERATLRQIRKALDSIRGRDYILVDPVWFPIWDAKSSDSRHRNVRQTVQPRVSANCQKYS